MSVHNIRPRKLTYTLSIEISSIFISKGYNLLFHALNNIYSDLFTFKDSLFTLSHSSIPHNYLFSLHSNSTISFGLTDRGTVRDRVVSSAYIMKLNSQLAFGKSLMYMISNRGPRIEPRGTPVEMGSILD